MPRPAQRSRLAALSLALASFVVLFACQDNIPSQPEFARVNTRYQLTIKGTGTTAGGSVVSDRGGISCTIQSNGGVQGKCSQGFKAGAIVTLTATAAAGAQFKTFGSNCEPSGDTGLGCHVEVVVNFSPQSNTFVLSIGAGASGSGTVSSSPSGISCTITNGATSGACAFSYPLNQNVTVTANASSGSYLKAWAGGGCDASGTIAAGSASGSCAVTLSQAVAVVVSFDRPANAALVGQW